ncbi:MAG: hypothetical protein WA052_00465 [Microgenomates group bacterium]
MENRKKFDLTGAFIVILVLSVVALLVFLGNFAVKNNLLSLPQINLFSKNTKALNPNAYYFSSPIFNLYSAKITQKTKDSLSVDVVPVTPPVGYENNISNFKINVTDTTEITKPKLFIPYVFKTVSDTSSSPDDKLSFNDLSVGEFIDIILTEDLRTANINNLVAKTISRISDSNLLTGEIKEVNPGSIMVVGIVRPISFNPIPANVAIISPTEKNYTISISDNTEIVTTNQTGPQRLSSGDLKTGTFVTVYADAPITNDTLSAALISLYSLGI